MYIEGCFVDILAIGERDGLMKIRELSIRDIGGIHSLQLNFSQGLNVICGANGVGKTTILNIICDAFGDRNSLLKKKSGSQTGTYKICVEGEDGKDMHLTKEIAEFKPSESSPANSYLGSVDLINVRANRDIRYRKLSSVPMDDIYHSNNSTISGEGIKGWLENRFLFNATEGSLTKPQQKNFELAKLAFNLLDDTLSFKAVTASDLEVILDSPRGPVYFEYLSDGYKSCIYILVGIIKEIETRFKEPFMYAGDFSGVIMIDEVDMHLHPSWQAKLVLSLKSIFPNAQIILSTHSPSVLQILEPGEIIPLAIGENGDVAVKKLELGRFGLQGWSLEEILKYVMDVPGTTSALYSNTMDKYNKALCRYDYEGAKENLGLLLEMLHPDSVLRTLLPFQMNGMRPKGEK